MKKAFVICTPVTTSGDVTVGGAMLMKSTVATAYVAFATEGLAQNVFSAFGLSEPTLVIPASELGTVYPENSENVNHFVLFDTAADFDQWVSDKAAFPVADHLVRRESLA